MTKSLFPKIENGEPPWLVLEAWNKKELELGRPLNRDDLAQIASFVIVHYMLTEPVVNSAAEHKSYVAMCERIRQRENF